MNNDQQFQQNIQTGSGLTRYRSAPSSYFSSLLNDAGFGPSDDFDHLFNPRASSPETQRIFSRFMNGADSIQENCSQSHIDNDNNSQFIQYAKHEPEAQQLQRQQSNEYSSSTQVIYQVHNSDQASSSGAMDNSYNRQMGSFNTNPGAQMKIEGGSNSSLIRHRSSPAGLFANIDIENEPNREGLFSSASKFKSQIDFSSRIMDPISEIENKGIGENNPGDGDYISGYQMNSWDDSSFLPDNFLNNEDKRFQNASSSDDQNNEGGNRSKTLLSHHLSLPKSAMEKLMQDSVPCKIRAKRGFATHPRSIAERVRRTKISERMRKLQELVPNMDKQTNTSDMLDLAVDYIKDLQRQVNTLSDKRANCSCSAQHKS